jgi:hypothetical protein
VGVQAVPNFYGNRLFLSANIAKIGTKKRRTESIWRFLA